MKIRKATKKDFKGIYKIIKEEYGKKPYNEKWTWKNGLKTLNYYFKLGEIYVATIKNKIVGFIMVSKGYYNEGPQLIIEELAVDSKYQKKGIGRRLMKKAESDCKKLKIKIICLRTHKKGAFGFYKKIGYKYNKSVTYFSKELK